MSFLYLICSATLIEIFVVALIDTAQLSSHNLMIAATNQAIGNKNQKNKY